MQTNIKVTGMHCASCKALLEDVTQDIPGVTKCTIDPEQGTGIVEHDATFNFDNLVKAVATLGTYTIEKI